MSVYHEEQAHAYNLLLCQRQQLLKRNTYCVVELVRELIAVKSGANIHKKKNGFNYELTSRVAAIFWKTLRNETDCSDLQKRFQYVCESWT